jgi:type I restriction enzyme R subunit
MNEADTCRGLVVPKLQAAGWEAEPHRINAQVTFTDGRIVVAGRKARRRPGKRADYILRFSPDMPIALVEAKPEYKTPGDALQQAKQYAEILGLRFAYVTNGSTILEFDCTTWLESSVVRHLDALADRIAALSAQHHLAERKLEALTPAVFDRAFRGEV